MDQAAVEQTGERVHVRRRRIVHPGQVQSRRTGGDVAGLRNSGPRRVGRSSGVTRRSRLRRAVGGCVAVRSDARSIRDEPPGRRQNSREICGWLFRTLSAGLLQTFGRLAHR